MDGVLVDSEPIHTEIERKLFSLLNISISDEEHSRYQGTASRYMWEDITLKHSLEKTSDELLQWHEIECIRHFSELEQIPTMPEIADLLKSLQANGYKLAVASSSSPEIIELILAKTGLKNYFPVIVSAEEAGKSKPEPDVFLLAAKKLGVNPKDCLVVEDSENGIKAARAANMRVIAYQSSSCIPEKQKEADDVVQSFSQLGMLIGLRKL